MPPDSLQLLPGLTESELVGFRWSSYDVPFWARENSAAGRWNHAGIGSTQYWSLTPDAAWAELIRQEDLNSEADLDGVRMPFWVARFPSGMIVDLRLAEERDRWQVDEPDLVAEDWSACQVLGTRIRQQHRGVIAPCAALAGHGNLTVFGRRRAIEWDHRPVLTSTVPASRVAIGRPAPGLVDRVIRRPPAPSGPTLF